MTEPQETKLDHQGAGPDRQQDMPPTEQPAHCCHVARRAIAQRPVFPPGAWPRLMPAPMAAAYCGEESVKAFRRKVGTMYPVPVVSEGSRQKWLRDDLDAAILMLAGKVESSTAFDAASVL